MLQMLWILVSCIADIIVLKGLLYAKIISKTRILSYLIKVLLK